MIDATEGSQQEVEVESIPPASATATAERPQGSQGAPLAPEAPEAGKRAPMILDGHVGPIQPFMPSTTEELVRLVDIIVRGGCVPKGYEYRDGPNKGAPDKAKMVAGILAGREVGFGPMMSLRTIMVVNGMPSVWGAGAKALVLRSGLVTDYRKEWIDVDTIDHVPAKLATNDPDFEKKRARVTKLQEDGFVKLYQDGDDYVVAKKLKLPASSVPTKEWPSQLGCFIAVARKGVATPYTGQFSVGDAQRAGLWEGFGKLYGKYPTDMLEHRAAARSYDRGFSDCLMGIAIRELLDEQEPDGTKVASDDFLRVGSSSP
jgi:hypothetical protein